MAKLSVEDVFGYLRERGLTNVEKYEAWEAKHGPSFESAHLEMTDGGLICLTKPIEKMSRQEAVGALIQVAHSKTTNREGLMQSLMDRANLPQHTYSKAYGAQLDPRKADKLHYQELIESLDTPVEDYWGKGRVDRNQIGSNGNEIRVDHDAGAFIVFGEAELKHNPDLKIALKCAINGDERGLKRAISTNSYVHRNAGRLKDVLNGAMPVDPETLELLGMGDQNASNTVIDGDTGDVEGDPYGGQFRSDWWR